MATRNDSTDPERGVAVNSATDPQRPGSPSGTPAAKDSDPPGTTAAETTVPTDSATATHEPGPAKGPEDRGGEPGRGGVE
jgi:hypothetical protein